MAIKYIPQSWKDDLSGPTANFNSDTNFYINPRGRVLPALTSAGVSYIKNDATTNMRGTYRMQCGASTGLTYLYTLPQRFIIEGWFKPEFSYTAGDQSIFSALSGTNGLLLQYATSVDAFNFATYVGGTGNAILTTAFTSDAQLQKWIYVRCFFDNIAKLKGFYCAVNGVVYADSQNVPGAGDFVPRNTVSFFTTVAAESSYWIIHELDETLTLGQYKTYQADRQIIFDFNGTTLGRERLRIPRNSSAADLRGVRSYNISKAIEKNGSACANTADLSIFNFKGQFSDDQYDAFDPFQGYYNGPQKYLQNRVGVEIEAVSPSTTASDGGITILPGTLKEPIFIGRTTPGAFSRTSPNHIEGMVNITAEDGIAELGETKLSRSYAYNNSVAAYKLSYPTDESLSLMHIYSRLVTKHAVINYALNSSGENATPANSWLVSGAGITLSRSNTVAQFGTYSLKCIATGAGDYIRQTIKFETADFIDKDEVFNFSAYVYQGTASMVKIQIEELNNAGALIGSASETACGTDTGVFTRVNVSRTILSALCTELRITFYALGASTFYVDGIMLTRGIDPIDYFLLNANDGAAGIGSAESAATYLYDTVAFDFDEVTLSHPYAMINKGDTAWEHEKDIGDATIVRYLGMTADGVMKYAVAYNETDPPTLGAITNISSIAATLDVNQNNATRVEGVVINKPTDVKPVWNGDGVLVTNNGGGMMHPIDNGAFLEVQGATTIEAKYQEY